MKKAILVIDMQNICVGKNHAACFNYSGQLVESVNEIIHNNQGHDIIYIRNIMKHNFINKFAPFKAYEGTKEIELTDCLKVVTDKVFDKYKADAFSNKKLDEYLKNHDIDTVEVIGVDGGGCVAQTALGAVKNGYQVIVNTKGIGTMFHKKQAQYFELLRKKGAQII